MEFNSLKASIANNSDQQPSIYMALCMVESLFDDMEEAFGSEISQGPVGDDTLPNKLIWLCNTLLGIYHDNKEDLTRNRVRLDAAVKKLDADRGALEAAAEDARMLEQLKRESALMQAQLSQAGQLRQSCDAAAAQCAVLKQELEQLRKFDINAADAELSELRQQIQTLTDRKAKLETDLSTARITAAQLQTAVERLSQEEQQLRGSNGQVNQRKAELEQTIASHRSSNFDMDTHLDKLEQEARLLCEELDRKTAEAAQQFDANEAFREETLAPVLQKLADAKQGFDSLIQQKANAETEYKKLQTNRSNTVMEIAGLKNNCETLSQELIRKEAECDAVKQSLEQLTADREDAVLQLSQLQKSVSDLQTKELPEMETRVQEEEERKTGLENQITQAREKYNRLVSENRRLAASAEETDKTLKATQDIYDALTATDTTKTKELERLEQKLKELQDKSDEEKYTIYKRQLEENIASLQKLQSDCEKIKAQDAQLLVDINQLQNKRSELLERKQTHETGKKAAETLLQQLGSLDTEAYRQEVVQVAHQLAVLETVYGKLCVSFAMINKTLGGSPFEQELPLNDQIKKNLTTLKSCATEMRTSLIQCANSLKMEEK